MLVSYWLFQVFVLGAIVGSFLNVLIARLPLEKSIIWPGSRCGKCQTAIRWYDNIPLFSYLRLRGRCRACGASFSIRYFLVELLCALGFVGLFYAEVILNIHDWPGQMQWWPTLFPWPVSWGCGFLFHAILFSLLLAASMCDLDCREIPLGITIPGSIIGLVGAVLMPWPWPNSPAPPVVPQHIRPEFVWMFGKIPEGIYVWPPVGLLPDFLEPGGNWQTGLATGLTGIFVGTFLLRGIGFIFSKGLNKEALGLGDADLMMMAGAFLGWQPIVVAFFVSVAPALLAAGAQWIIRRDNSLPFGPHLAIGVMFTCLAWPWVGRPWQMLFFWGSMILAMCAVLAVLMFIMAFAMRRLRG